MQFDDGADLMLFRIRRNDGSADPYSAGTYVDARGREHHLAAGDFSLTPGKTWTSAATHGRYPIEWRVRVPALDIDAGVMTRLPQQELTGRTPYWEGAIEITGSRRGVGYLEMTGYAGPVYMGG
jgi:predicted secreted hydrolase